MASPVLKRLNPTQASKVFQESQDAQASKTARVVVDIILLEGFSLLPVSALLEAIRLANRLGQQNIYRANLIGLTDQPVTSSTGTPLPVDQGIDDLLETTNVIVCGQGCRQKDKKIVPALHRFQQQSATIGALCGGTYWLAKAAILNGYRCTVHWAMMDSLCQCFPELKVTTDLFVIDRDRFTCSGGCAVVDLFLQDVQARCGASLAGELCNHLIYDRCRCPYERQCLPVDCKISTLPKALIDAITVMEQALEQPLSLQAIAQACGISRRQLERLCLRFLGVGPAKYYLQLRLERARNLLAQTTMPITEISFACGFTSCSYFAKCYRARFESAPGQARLSMAAQGWRQLRQ